MSKIIVTGQLTLTGGQLTAKETAVAPPAPPAGKSLWTWGSGLNGRSGLGNVTDYSSPVQIGSLTDWANIAAGYYSGHAIKTDGSLWSWGAGTRLGIEDNITRSSPVQVGALTDWSSVDAGLRFALAVKTDGTLWAWGRNDDGHLGLGDDGDTDRSSPVQVGGLTNWASISVGSVHSLAVKTDGTLWTWGAGVLGRIGDGTVVSKSSPVQVGILTDWASVSGGNAHCLAIKTDGSLWAWGDNIVGQLGIGDQNNERSSPVQVGSLTDWFSVGAGSRRSHAIKTDGSVWSWGRGGNYGSLGDGTRLQDRNSPVQIGFLTNWSKIDAGKYLTHSIKTDGTLWGWGDNSDGQLGDGTVNDRSSPIQVGSLTDWFSNSDGRLHTIALKSV